MAYSTAALCYERGIMVPESSKRKLKILVTGGSGFIGTHLGQSLAEDGHEVVSLDLVAPKAPHPLIRFFQGDIRHSETLSLALKDCDAVFQFAAIASIPRCQENPVESYETNLLATPILMQAVAQEMKRTGRPLQVIFSSTSAVYGDPGTSLKAAIESAPATELKSFYASQKFASEQAIRIFAQLHSIPAVVFRFFNVFGPGQDPKSHYSGVISIFLENIKNGLPLRLNGGGKQTRDFVSVFDIVRACKLALDLPSSACDGHAINLGTGKSISIQELAANLMKLSGKSVPIENAPWREGDILHSLADISRAKQLLMWEAQFSLEKPGLTNLSHFYGIFS